MSLLDKARAAPARQNAVVDYTHEHYELAIALLRKSISVSQFTAAMGVKSSTMGQYRALQILQDGVARGWIDVRLIAAAGESLPRLCDGAVQEEGDEAA